MKPSSLLNCVVGTALLGLLSSCMVGPNYVRTDPETGDGWVAAGAD